MMPRLKFFLVVSHRDFNSILLSPAIMSRRVNLSSPRTVQLVKLLRPKGASSNVVCMCTVDGLPPSTLLNLLILRLDKERLLFGVAKQGISFTKLVFWHGHNSAAIPSMNLTLKALGLFTYHQVLLTRWSRAVPENLTVPQLVKKFPAFYGTRRFITAFASDSHLYLSWARSILSMPHHIPIPEDPF